MRIIKHRILDPENLEPCHREEPGSTEEGEPGSRNQFVENLAVAQMDEPSFVETLNTLVSLSYLRPEKDLQEVQRQPLEEMKS